MEGSLGDRQEVRLFDACVNGVPGRELLKREEHGVMTVFATENANARPQIDRDGGDILRRWDGLEIVGAHRSSRISLMTLSRSLGDKNEKSRLFTSPASDSASSMIFDGNTSRAMAARKMCSIVALTAPTSILDISDFSMPARSANEVWLRRRARRSRRMAGPTVSMTLTLMASPRCAPAASSATCRTRARPCLGGSGSGARR